MSEREREIPQSRRSRTTPPGSSFKKQSPEKKKRTKKRDMCKRERDGLKNRAEERGASRQGIVLKKKRKTKCVKRVRERLHSQEEGEWEGELVKGEDQAVRISSQKIKKISKKIKIER